MYETLIVTSQAETSALTKQLLHAKIANQSHWRKGHLTGEPEVNNSKLCFLTHDVFTSLAQTQHGGGPAEGVQRSDFEVFNLIYIF